MTAEEVAFHKAIAASPDDDLPRLVYADWLDEHGRGEMAELIRVQCEADRDAMPPATDPAESFGESVHAVLDWNLREEQLWRRQTELIAAVRTDGFDGVAVTFRRGMATVRCRLAELVGGELVCDWCDGAGTIRVADAAGDMDDDTCPRCGGQRTFRITGHGPALVRAIPVERVEVDREPMEDGGEWMWASSSDTSTWRFDVHRESLTMDVAKHLSGGRHHPETRSIVAQWWFPTRDAAMSALSDALLAWARTTEG